MAGISKAEREARAFLVALDNPMPLARARVRLAVKTDKRYGHKGQYAPKQSPAQQKVKRRAARVVAKEKRGVEVTLRTAHWVGGINYGPGTVMVPAGLAPCLLENERRVEYNNQRFDGSQSAFIGPSGRAIRVPAGVMDNSFATAPEAFSL